jgi:hypothetical protein
MKLRSRYFFLNKRLIVDSHFAEVEVLGLGQLLNHGFESLAMGGIFVSFILNVHVGHEAPKLLARFGLMADLFKLPLADVTDGLRECLELAVKSFTPEEINQVHQVMRHIGLLAKLETS